MGMEGAMHTAAEVARARRTILIDGVFSRFMDTVTGGAFLTGLALYLGAGTMQLALIAALPFLSQVMQVPAVKLLMYARNRRRIVLVAATASRSLLLVIAGLVYWRRGDVTPWALVGIMAAMTLVIVFSNSAWNWWMRDIMPHAELGRYFGRRLQVTAAIAASLTPVAGYLLDRFRGAGIDYAGYALLFAAGGVAGWMSSVFLALTPHRNAQPQTQQKNALRAILAPLRDRRHQRLAVALMLVAATLTIMLPFTSIYLLRTLHYSFLGVSILALVSQFAYVGSLRSWGYLSDRFGHRPVLLISVGMVVASLIGWAFTWGGSVASLYVLLLVLHFVAGFSVAGIDLTAATILLKSAPSEGAPAFMASLSVTRALVAGIATLVAGAVWTRMGTGALVTLDLPYGVTWVIRGFHILALASVAVGMLALWALRGVEEPDDQPVVEVARAMRRETRMLSSVAGIRAFVHAVSYVVEFFAQPAAPQGPRAAGRRTPAHESASAEKESGKEP